VNGIAVAIAFGNQTIASARDRLDFETVGGNRRGKPPYAPDRFVAVPA